MFKKQFSQQDFNDSDEFCRNALKAWLPKQIPGCIVEDNPDKFGVDVYCFVPVGQNRFELESVELEQCLNWTDDSKFPYSFVTIPFRKLKFLNQGCHFMMISKSGKTALFIPSGAHYQITFKSNNRSGGKDEPFFVFDLKECGLLDLTSDEKQLFLLGK